MPPVAMDMVAGVASASLAPFRSRSFTVMWAGALVSNIGTWMETVALAYYVADTTGKPSWSAIEKWWVMASRSSGRRRRTGRAACVGSGARVPVESGWVRLDPSR